MNQMTSLYLIPLLFSSISSYRILVWTTVIAKTHLDFATSCVDKLIERGHTVDVVLARMNTIVTSNGSRHAKRFIDLTFKGPNSWMKSIHLKEPFADAVSNIEMTNLFYAASEQLCEDALSDDRILDFLKEETYDLVLTSSYDYCSIAILHASGIHNIASISPTPITFNQMYMNGLPVPPGYIFDCMRETYDHLKLTFMERMRNLLRTIFYDLIGYSELFGRMDKVVRARFGNSFPSVSDLSTRINLLFLNVNEILEEPRPISHKIKYIGGINMKEAKPLTKEFDVILAKAKRGNVIFSFGTQVSSSKIPWDVRKSFITAFRRLPEYNFIWKYDDAEEDKSLFLNATNVIPTQWLPQVDLLRDPRVVAFISHVGMNSLMEAAHAGVPLIALPLFADQMWNANSAKKHGIAVVVKKNEVTEETIFRALSTVLENEEMKKQSKKIAEMLKKKPENVEEQFVKWVEYAAEFKDLHHHLNLQGAHMSGIETNGLDVGAVLLCGILTCLAIFTFVVKRLGFIMLMRATSIEQNFKKVN